jgi:hypothetical protein
LARLKVYKNVCKEEIFMEKHFTLKDEKHLLEGAGKISTYING